MDISSGLIAKGTAGALAAAATTAGVVYRDQIFGFDDVEGKSKPTKWDDALINYLREGGKNRDITFTIKTGKDANTTWSSGTFPSFEDAVAEGNEQKSIATITVTVSTTSAQLKGDGADAEIIELKKMNKKEEEDGQDWTWECKIVFSKNKETDDSTEFENKNDLFGSDGFFDKLTKDGNEKGIKNKFIRNCAKSREGDKSAKYEEKTSLDNGEKITSEKTFDLRKDSKTKKLKMKQREFDYWFSEAKKNKQPQADSHS